MLRMAFVSMLHYCSLADCLLVRYTHTNTIHTNITQVTNGMTMMMMAAISVNAYSFCAWIFLSLASSSSKHNAPLSSPSVCSVQVRYKCHAMHAHAHIHKYSSSSLIWAEPLSLSQLIVIRSSHTNTHFILKWWWLMTMDSTLTTRCKKIDWRHN